MNIETYQCIWINVKEWESTYHWKESSWLQIDQMEQFGNSRFESVVHYYGPYIILYTHRIV